jgi:hypothetical protein
MKLIKAPKAKKNRIGGIEISDAYIWSPSDEAGLVFERLRTGCDEGIMRIGKKYNHLIFKSEGITLYDIQAVESFDNDTYRCTVNKFAFHTKEEK